jgi:hypothetical protein
MDELVSREGGSVLASYQIPISHCSGFDRPLNRMPISLKDIPDLEDELSGPKIISAVCCLLSAVCCLMPTVCCLLSAICYLLSAV